MKRLFIIAISLVSLLFILPGQSFAAYSATDGTVKGELQITPKDPPYAGQPSRLKLQFSDTPKGFSLRACDCQLTVEQPGRLPSNIPLTLQNEAGPDVQFVTVSYLFPSNANYKLTMLAQPKQAGAFQPFTLSWNVDVQKNEHLVPYSSHKDKGSSQYLGIAISSGVVILFVLYILYRYLRKKKKKK